MATYLLQVHLAEASSSMATCLLLLILLPVLLLPLLLLFGFLPQTLSRMWNGQTAFMPSLKGKHFVITGGSTGIGYCIAQRCLMEGAHVTLMARTVKNLLDARDSLLQTVACSKDDILLKAVDVACPSAMAAAIRESFLWRPIDVLVCNAGIIKTGFFEEVSVQDHEAQIRTNFLGSVFPVHAALPLLKQRAQRNPVSIVFVNSLVSLFFACGTNSYMISKYAQKGLAELLRVELMPHNINVQMVCPGYTETAMLDEADKFSSLAPMWSKLLLFERKEAERAEDVARVTVEAVKRGNFLSTTTVKGHLVGVLGRALAPQDRPLHALLDLLLLLPLFRLISLPVASIFNVAVRSYPRLLHHHPPPIMPALASMPALQSPAAAPAAAAKHEFPPPPPPPSSSPLLVEFIQTLKTGLFAYPR